jgi:hypothetical protein
MSDVEWPKERLPDPARRLHRALIQALIAEGAVPPAETLSIRADVALGNLPEQMHTLAAADYAAFDDTGRLTCLYPFSPTPTPRVVTINGRPRYAMCAIDALGIPAMLGQELAIAGRCAVCNQAIALRVGPGKIVSATPATALVVARRDEAEPAFTACCPFTVFACNQDHAEQLRRRISGGHILPLLAAQARAEEIFAGLLAEPLPASRPRGKSWNALTTREPILYTQDGCSESAQVRVWLNERDVAFRERNASSDAAVARALAATGTFATPLFVVGEQKVLGFRPEALAAALRADNCAGDPVSGCSG